MGLVAERRHAHAPELVALQSVTNTLSSGQSARKSPVADLVDDAELAAELHRADADLQHLGGIELVLALLDQQRRDTAPPEIGGKRKPDRAAAGDQHGRFAGRVSHQCKTFRCRAFGSRRFGLPQPASSSIPTPGRWGEAPG